MATATLLGVGLFAYGRTIPVYHDLEAARALKGPDACDTNGVVDGWYEQLMALETMRHPLMQSGISLVLATATIGIIILVFGTPDKVGLRSPRKRWVFFVLGFGVVALSWFSQMFSLHLDMTRGQFPWCADSIAIPAFGITYLYVAVLFACLVAGGLIMIGFNSLPVRLFQWDSIHQVKSWLLTIPFALLGGVLALAGLDGAFHSSFLGTPAALVALFLIEATRSALLAPPDSLTEAPIEGSVP